MGNEKRYKLTDTDLMTSSEASARWGKDQSYVRQLFKKYPGRFKEGTYRKFGSVFVITKEGMEYVTKEKELSERDD
ncbi:hypothetical protein HCA69_15975 [Listeria grandensis]|uniref:Helix-turn-helix domain-containing protein n=1 Tax=Listeria grandensis TaxID=1494963 RepID=A0A7X0Y7I2_9LIST|nr:helix-turn-helix domain-containing protein [Listeria grandensis]MBC1937862.1 hypothetical protein [Listeria grandensis]